MMASDEYTMRALVERGESLAALGWRIIDAHAHLGPTGTFLIPTPDAASMVAMMDRLGIDRTLLASHLAISCDFARGNDLTAAAVRAYPDRLYGYVVVNARYPEEVEGELRRGLDQLGLQGIKLHPNFQGYCVDDPALASVWRCAEERGIPVLVHTWDRDPNCRPSFFAPLAEAHPTVPFILGHSGGTPTGVREAVAVAREHPNIYLDICGSLLTSNELEWMVAEVGAERVLFATDVPWLDPRFELGRLAYARLSVEEQRLILGENIARLLGWG